MTLFGIVDASVSHVSNKSDLYFADPLALVKNPLAGYGLPGSIKASKTGMNNSAYNSSRLGFRGVEDLGGGLAASFWLEAALGNDEGTGAATGGGLNFQRRSTVSLSGAFGEVRLGRDYKATFNNLSVFDPFGTNGSGTNIILQAAGTLEGGVGNVVRASNTIGYFLPRNLGGFYGQAQYSFHEQAKFDSGTQGFGNDNSRGGGYWGGRFGYANGPLDVAVAYAERTNSSSWSGGPNGTGATDNVAKSFNAGVSYDLGVVKLFGQYAKVKNKDEFNGAWSSTGFVGASTLDGYLLGATAPVGAGLIRASYGHVKIRVEPNPLLADGTLNPAALTYADQKADQFAVGYVHNLSKRTALYATVSYIKNKNGAAFSNGSNSITAAFAPKYSTTLNGAKVEGVYRANTSLGYDLGIRHSF